MGENVGLSWNAENPSKKTKKNNLFWVFYIQAKGQFEQQVKDCFSVFTPRRAKRRAGDFAVPVAQLWGGTHFCVGLEMETVTLLSNLPSVCG